MRMNNSIDHDQLFKQLIQTFFLDFLALFAPELLSHIQPDTVEFLPQEYFTDLIEGERKAIDLLARVELQVPLSQPASGKRRPSQAQMVLIHLENQALSKAQFEQRIFFYFSQLHNQHRIPIYPLVIFSFETPYRPELSEYRITLPGLDVLSFKFHAVQLNRLNWRDFLQYQNPIAAALMAKMRIAPEDRPKVKVECLRLLVTLKLDPARSFLISSFVDTYLRLNAIEEDSFQAEVAKIKMPQEREKIMQLTTSWLEKGLEQGLERGLEQGLEQGRQMIERLVQRLLVRKFESVPKAVAHQIQQLSIEQLESLHEAAMDFSSIENLIDWLAQRP